MRENMLCSNSPNNSNGNQQDGSREEEGESFHEVQCGWVKSVVEAAAHQKTQGLHTANSCKQGTCVCVCVLEIVEKV